MGGRSPFQQDRVSISPQGKASGIVDALNQQKLAIEDRKNNLMASAQEDGLSMESIQAQLNCYDEQIEKIDEQIAQATVQQMTACADEQMNVGKKSGNQPKTEQDVQKEKMDNLMKLSSGLDRVSVTKSVQTRVDGESAVLESEIELDKGRISTADKEAELAQLRQQSISLTAQIGKRIANLSHQWEESSRPVDHVEGEGATQGDAFMEKHGQRLDKSGASAFQTRMEQYAQVENAMEGPAPTGSCINMLV